MARDLGRGWVHGERRGAALRAAATYCVRDGVADVLDETLFIVEATATR